MELIFAAVGIALSVWAVVSLMKPPRKYKDYSLKDQNEAVSRSLGGGRVPDASDVEPPGSENGKR